MSKTVKKYTHKLGAITNAEKLEEREAAIEMINELKQRKAVRLVKVSNTPPTWVAQKC